MKVPAPAGSAPAARGDDAAFVDHLLRAGLVAVPGSALGPGGEGYVRWALVPTPEDCREAIARLEQAGA
jgi:aspartate/methionine/tyrosine aminotransferase